ncbi:MAG TPA: carboxylating nicotinate-nucleotide diphosphorylase [Candidatus Acidoferrales bacterium]|nr:carboxylating nicotinate-nucleotide diphosphorylase [Candidatus Acidoferrales bacterium]
MADQPSAAQFDWDRPELAHLVRSALEEDIGPRDATVAALISSSANARARIVAKQDLVIAGLPLVERVFRNLDPNVSFSAECAEGSRARPGDRVASLSGHTAAILSGERTAMNFLAHLCGVATSAHKYVQAMAGTKARLRDTRKTTPLLRALEKYAVRCGGGTNHRFGLYDAILIKENHIAAAGSIGEALRRARAWSTCQAVPQGGQRHADRAMTAYESYEPPRAASPSAAIPIQIEVRNEAELREALEAQADSVLLDNLSPAECARLATLVRAIRPACTVEASGGIDLATVRAYAESGVDFISVGALTHSAPAADLSLLVELP